MAFNLDPDALEDADFSKPSSMTENDDGSMDVNVDPSEQSNDSQDYNHYENIANLIEEDDLAVIAKKVIEGYKSDLESRKPWEDTIVRGLDLLGIQLKEVTEPFEGACGATHPMILEAAVKFQARAAKELFPPVGPVKVQVIGVRDEPKQMSASRVQDHMNYQINEQIEEYFPDMENLLLHLPIIGLAYKKITPDLSGKCPNVEFVPADQLVVPANAVDLKKAARYTHILYKNEDEMMKAQAFGTYIDVDLGTPMRPELTPITKKFNDLIGITSAVSENDEVYTLLEQHCYLDIEDDVEGRDSNGLAVPYVVTIELSSNKVLSIYRNWKLEDPDKAKRVWFVKYPFVPGFGFYSLGFIHLLGNFELTITTAMRTLVDSAQFATLQGGFKAKGLRIQNNDPLRPGEWKEMEATGMDLQKALLPVPYKDPSIVILQLLQYLEGRGQQFADSTEAVIADADTQGPVGTTLALLEASAKFFSGIHKRLHYAQKQEFKIIAGINQEFLPKEYPYDVIGGSRVIYAQDYDPANISVIPCSDPNISSNSHKIALAQTKLQVAQMFPGMVNPKPLIRDLFMCMNDGSDINLYIPGDPPPPQPQDPVTDIMSAGKGQAIQAFPGQDHDAHVAVKTAWMNDPSNGKNPMMQGALNSVQSNVRDHLMMKYQEAMGGAMQVAQKQMGMPQVPQQGPQLQGGQPPQDPKMGMAMQLAAKMVSHNNSVQSEVDGTQDPMLVAALAQKMDAENKAKEIEYRHQEAMQKIALEQQQLDFQKTLADSQSIQHQQKMGVDLVNKSAERITKESIENKRLETQKEIADKQIKAKPVAKKD